MSDDIAQVVVVGIDGLDIEKAQQWEPDLLMERHQPLALDGFELLRTSHIWPTMFAGETPVERGFDDPGHNAERRQWRNPVVDAASAIAAKAVPRSYRRRIGWVLARRGFTGDTLGGAQKPHRGLFEADCVFTDTKSRVIEVPGWNKNELDIKFNRAGAWGEVMDSDDGVEKFMAAIDEEYQVKRNLTTEAMDAPYDLVWTHFHFLDAVQHFFQRDTQRDWYATAADVLADIRAAADDRTAVVVLSDHGLGAHGHREPGLVCVADDRWTPLPERPREVRGWLERELLADRIDANAETVEHLADLGYRDFVGGGESA